MNDPQNVEKKSVERSNTILSPVRALVIIVLSILVIEFIELVFFSALPEISTTTEMIIDLTFMAVLISPALYFFLFRPLVSCVNEHERVSGKIIRAKKEWERTFDAVSDAILLVEGKHKVARVNKAMAYRMGRTPDECIGRPCFQIMHGLDEPPPDCPHTKLLDDGKEHSAEIHEELLGGDFLVTSSPIFSENGIPCGSVHISHDITERKKVEKKLANYRQHLEESVKERTVELTDANEQLKQEINERKKAEEVLRKKETELREKTGNLEEVNTALRVMLKKKDEVKTEIEENVLSNVRELIVPYVEKLKRRNSDDKHNDYLNMLESNLNDITSSFSLRLSSSILNLTPSEIQVADLIKHGKSTKDIADALSLSPTTIEFHRRNIRKKLGISNKKSNLRTYLKSLKE
jgi:PAS domain S-box-containing protein